VRDDCPRTAVPADCLDDNLVGAFVDGKLGGADRSRVERLIDQCSSCRRQVSEVMRVRSTLDAASPALDATAASGASPAAAQIGRYELRGTLGAGGMGVVMRAWDPQLEREVAIKLVRGGSADGALRLVREARAMAKVRHPAVLTVHDAGIVGGEVFVVMELVDGENLSEWFARKPPWREALARCKVAGAGLAAAHARGLVHRDFKPHNVLCDRDGRVLVADFGLARGSPGAVDAASALTSAGAIVGTPAYMAPEQHLGEAVGVAADQFALAATIYEGLFGVRPFAGNTLAALLSELLAGHVRPPPASTDVPPAITRVVLRGLAREPADRWPSVQALLDALEPGVDAGTTGRRVVPIAVGGAAAVVASSLIAWIVTRPDARSGERLDAQVVAAPAPMPQLDAGRVVLPSNDPPLRGGITKDRLASWNVLGELVAITARARAWAPDAELVEIAAGKGVQPDGTIDVSRYGSSGVRYTFFSPARTADPALGPCEHRFDLDYHGDHEFESPQIACTTTRAVPAPSCTVAEISRRLVAAGADAAKGISFRYAAAPGSPTWTAWQGNLRADHADDC